MQSKDMDDVFSNIELEEGERELWRGRPQQRVSPAHWWYLFIGAVAFGSVLALNAAGLLPTKLTLDALEQVIDGVIALIFAALPFLLARSTNSAQYLATDRRVFIHALEIFSYERNSYVYAAAHKSKVKPLHNGLASLYLTYITEKRGKRTMTPVLLYAIPAALAEQLHELASR